MKDLDLKTLRLLVAVCDHGSIKAAAAQAHIEPSAISKRLAQLEDTVGHTVLVRGRKGVELTTAGRTLMEHARSLLLGMDRMAIDMAAYSSGVQGQVRLAASSSAIAESLLDDLTLFMRDSAHQHIQVNIEEKPSSDIVSMVRGGLASLGVLWAPTDLNGLASLPYRHDRLVLAVHPQHPLARRKSILFEDTLAYPHVGLPSATAVHSMLHKTASQAGKVVNYRAIVSNFDGAFRVVCANLGISVVPQEVAAQYVASGQIHTVRLRNAWATRPFVICFHATQELSPAANQLLHFLAAQASR